MDKTINPAIEAERLDKLFRGLDSHIETVATEYHRAIGRAGKRLESELVKRGYDRSWLQCLEDIGGGRSDPSILKLEPTKRAILQTVSPARQREVVEKGILGKPLCLVKPDVLRQELRGGKCRISKAKRRLVPVSAHIRQAPSKPLAPEIVRVVVAGHAIKWHDIVTAVAQGAVAGTIPEKEIPRLLRAAELLAQKRTPVEVA